MKTPILLIATITAISNAEALPLVPLPVSVKMEEGTFRFTSETVVRFEATLKNEAQLFAADLSARSGTAHQTAEVRQKIQFTSEIRLELDEDAEHPAGGYTLRITPESAVVTGKDAAGVYYGTRSILQILPALGDAGWKDDAPEDMPALVIRDYPRFAWRGIMLDVGRHFEPADDIKRFIDWMAFHKLNTFHWHLTDDQGWRIEIKKYPKLTEVGAWRESTPPYGDRMGSDGKRYGGYYTQEQIKDVVAYAAARHVTIVPEIEMPGHAAAALASYPELGNTDIPGYAPEVITRWGVFPYIFAPKDETFRFLEDVLTEVCDLFPSQFIHVGGDEAPKDQWRQSPAAQDVMKREGLKNEEELQSWFIRRIAKFLETRNRRLIGWDEIQEGGLPQSATMMVWRDAKWAKHAIALGNDVVMATTADLYLDYYQAPAEQELAKGIAHEAIGGYLPIERVYAFNPTSVVTTPDQEKQVLGTQAQIWTEYIKDFKKVEYVAFPRMAAVSEVAWTPLERKDFADFRNRLDGLLKHYDGGKLNYYSSSNPAAGSSH